MALVMLIGRLEMHLLREAVAELGVEAVTHRARVLASSKVELALEPQMLSIDVMVHLHNVAAVQVTEERTTPIVLLAKVLAVDGDAVGGARPDADLEVFQVRPVLALLGHPVDGVTGLGCR